MPKLEVDVRYIIVGARIAGAEPGDELIVHNDVVIGIRPRHHAHAVNVEDASFVATPAFPTPPPKQAKPAPAPAPAAGGVATSMVSAVDLVTQTKATKVDKARQQPPPLTKFVSEESKVFIWDLLTANPDGLTMRKLADAYLIPRDDVLGRQRLRNVIDMMLRQKHVKPNAEDMEKEVRYPRYQAI